MFVAKRSSWWKFKFKCLLNPGSLDGKKKVSAVHTEPCKKTTMSSSWLECAEGGEAFQG